MKNTHCDRIMEGTGQFRWVSEGMPLCKGGISTDFQIHEEQTNSPQAKEKHIEKSQARKIMAPNEGW